MNQIDIFRKNKYENRAVRSRFLSARLVWGQAALPTIVLLGGLMVEVIVAGSLIVFLFNNSTYGARLSVEALGAAHSGIQDALLRISLDKNFSSIGYTLNVGSRSSANVVVTRDSPIIGKTTIISTGSALSRSRKVQSIVNINSMTGAMKVESISEISL